MLASWIADGAVTALMTSPSVLRTIALELEDRQRRVESIRLAIVTGERCEWGHLEVARRVLPNAVIMNQYGSTEAGPIAITTIEPHEPLGAGTIPFRNVLPWHTVDIFDESGAPLATGDAGEIVVRGSEVSLGYWKEPGSEEQRFFMGSDGVRFVRTGDRGRRLRDGTLEHLGRVDLRVKVRGQMVDPQAVEHALVGLPQVSEAVVSALPTPDGDTRLVAHVLPEGGEPVVPRELRLALAEQFPPYMIPSVFLAVDTMPRNSRGKVDRAMLRQAALGGASAVRGAHVPARTEKEHELAELVADVLDVESVGVTDDIFELGADSLTAAELLTEIHERLGVDLTTAHLLTAPTIEALAQQLDVSDPGEDGALPLSLAGPGTPFFCLPGGGFAVIELLPLARHLDRPIYSFVSRGFGSRALPHRSVARGAAYFMTAVRTVQPSGPYLIGGFSFGALFAYEMAQQLRAFGETVALLALLDPTWPSSNTLGDRVRQFAIATPDSPQTTSGSARRVLRRLENSMRVRGRRATAGIVARPYARQREVFLDLCLRIGRRYQPKPYAGPSLLVRTTGHTERGDLRDLAHLLTGEKQVVDVPGDHAAILRYPTLGAVAAILEDALNAADVQPAMKSTP